MAYRELRNGRAVEIDIMANQKKKLIETHTYRTPDADGTESWSVGVLHLTYEETRYIAAFVSQLIGQRGNLAEYVGGDPRPSYVEAPVARDGVAFRVPVYNALELPKPDPKPEPRSAMEERFAGLELMPEPKK